MKELTASQHLLRLLLVVGIGSVVAAISLSFLPAHDYQPSRPIWAGYSLVAFGAAYLLLRRRNSFASSVALRLVWVFAAVFVVTLFM